MDGSNSLCDAISKVMAIFLPFVQGVTKKTTKRGNI